MALTRRTKERLARLAEAEARFLQSEFLAPALRGGQVHVRVAGVVCAFQVDRDFEGWGVFLPTSGNRARLVRPATLAERHRYLALLPKRRFLLCQPAGRGWLARAADSVLLEDPLHPVWFVEEGERFDTILARTDGIHCWFESIDERADPARAAYLRGAFGDNLPTERLHRRGLTGGERSAYALAYELRRQTERDRTEDRLYSALLHAGANLRGYVQREENLRVEFEVDGKRYVTALANDLSVQTAGICLNGEDQRFDLASLVGVLREAEAEFVPRVGAENAGMEEADYWRIHPPS